MNKEKVRISFNFTASNADRIRQEADKTEETVTQVINRIIYDWFAVRDAKRGPGRPPNPVDPSKPVKAKRPPGRPRENKASIDGYERVDIAPGNSVFNIPEDYIEIPAADYVKLRKHKAGIGIADWVEYIWKIRGCNARRLKVGDLQKFASDKQLTLDIINSIITT